MIFHRPFVPAFAALLFLAGCSNLSVTRNASPNGSIVRRGDGRLPEIVALGTGDNIVAASAFGVDVKKWTPSRSAAPGQEIGVSLYVQNVNSTALTKVPWTISESGTVIGSGVIDTIAPGAEKQVTVRFTIDAQNPHNLAFTGTANPKNELKESDAGLADNSIAISVPVAAK